MLSSISQRKRYRPRMDSHLWVIKKPPGGISNAQGNRNRNKEQENWSPVKKLTSGGQGIDNLGKSTLLEQWWRRKVPTTAAGWENWGHWWRVVDTSEGIGVRALYV